MYAEKMPVTCSRQCVQRPRTRFDAERRRVSTSGLAVGRAALRLGEHCCDPPHSPHSGLATQTGPLDVTAGVLLRIKLKHLLVARPKGHVGDDNLLACLLQNLLVGKDVLVARALRSQSQHINGRANELLG